MSSHASREWMTSGKPNEPANVVHVGAALARARAADPGEVAALTRANAARVFGVEQ